MKCINIMNFEELKQKIKVIKAREELTNLELAEALGIKAVRVDSFMANRLKKWDDIEEYLRAHFPKDFTDVIEESEYSQLKSELIAAQKKIIELQEKILRLKG